MNRWKTNHFVLGSFLTICFSSTTLTRKIALFAFSLYGCAHKRAPIFTYRYNVVQGFSVQSVRRGLSKFYFIYFFLAHTLSNSIVPSGTEFVVLPHPLMFFSPKSNTGYIYLAADGIRQIVLRLFYNAHKMILPSIRHRFSG